MNNSFLIGAASSGCGKTTFTMGLLRALRDRGFHVQPFKSGPDYIDPLFHHLASGQESVNLDTVMSSHAHVQDLFHHYGDSADTCIIEAAMGLFDGADGPRGSAAEIAQLLDVPVILLVSAKAVAYSVAPLIYGFRHFNPALRIAGVVFNFVASQRQLSTLLRACEDVGVPCLGHLPRHPELQIPSRHLGLTLEEHERTEHLICLAAKEVEEHVDMERIVKGYKDHVSGFKIQDSGFKGSLSICVARDAAFNFTYRANIDALRHLGTVTFISPLQDTALPPCDFLYLPGGYPELFAAELAANTSMRESIRHFAEAGGRILAECGGFMYLCRDIDGQPMCNVLPYTATMNHAHLHLGYRETRLNGITLRGHEFHYSSTIPEAPFPFIRHKNVLAGYTHWYWAENPMTLSKLFSTII